MLFRTVSSLGKEEARRSVHDLVLALDGTNVKPGHGPSPRTPDFIAEKAKEDRTYVADALSRDMDEQVIDRMEHGAESYIA